jgi:ubiquinone/menaquinone biosynthesis C-methylase UbiE
MSAYERYDEAAPAFDRARTSLGAELIAGALSLVGRPLSELRLLDGGCGTGNYAAALTSLVGQVTAIDFSAGMLALARAKLAAEERAGRIAFHRGSIAALPFAGETFDAVMFNQVLHHLEEGADPTYGGHARALAEAWRVLRPGGVVVVNACTHEQLYHGFWYYALIPEALEAVLTRCAPAERLQAILAETGFAFKGRAVPLDGVMQGPAYFDPRGPLDPAWRQSDSIWALVAPEALAQALEQFAALDRDGALNTYLAEHDVQRPTHGQFTFFTAVKA